MVKARLVIDSIKIDASIEKYQYVSLHGNYTVAFPH